MLLSLLFHALLLSLTFGGQEFGLPGFALPWQERRVEVPDLRIELAPTGGADPSPAIPAAPQPLSPVLTGQAAAGGPLVVTFSSPARPLLRRTEGSVPRKAPKAKAHPKPKTKAVSGEAPTKASSAKPGQKQKATTSAAKASTPGSTSKATATGKPKAATGTAPVSVRADGANRPKSFPKVIALEDSSEAEFVVPPAPLKPAPAVSVAPEDAGGEAQARVDEPTQEIPRLRRTALRPDQQGPRSNDSRDAHSHDAE